MGATSIGNVEPQADVMDGLEAHGDASNQAEACEEAGFRFFFVMLHRERSAYKLRCAVGVVVLRWEESEGDDVGHEAAAGTASERFQSSLVRCVFCGDCVGCD